MDITRAQKKFAEGVKVNDSLWGIGIFYIFLVV